MYTLVMNTFVVWYALCSVAGVYACNVQCAGKCPAETPKRCAAELECYDDDCGQVDGNCKTYDNLRMRVNSGYLCQIKSCPTGCEGYNEQTVTCISACAQYKKNYPDDCYTCVLAKVEIEKSGRYAYLPIAKNLCEDYDCGCGATCGLRTGCASCKGFGELVTVTPVCYPVCDNVTSCCGKTYCYASYDYSDPKYCDYPPGLTKTECREPCKNVCCPPGTSCCADDSSAVPGQCRRETCKPAPPQGGIPKIGSPFTFNVLKSVLSHRRK